MKRPVWRDGELALEEVEDSIPRAPSAARYKADFPMPPPSPVMDVHQALQEQDGTPPADDPQVVFYKCDCGRYLTDSMIEQGICAGHVMRYAVEMNDEQAEALATELEAMALDKLLDENETLLLKIIRSKLGERWM